MKIEHLTDEDLEAWQENPVTLILKHLVRSEINARLDSFATAYMAGHPVSDADRDAVKLASTYFEAIFEVDKAEDVKQQMEINDE